MSRPTTKKSGLFWPLLLSAVLIAAIALGVAAELRGAEGHAADGSDTPAADGVSEEMREMGEGLARRDAEDPMAMGAVDAPVVLIAYSDYQCPFCGTWVHETQPELVEHYVDDGSLRIEWRDFPYLGEASTTLAVGGQAAAEQQAFWDYHEAVYAAQDELKNAGSDVAETMADLAADAGLDRDRFTADLRDEELAAAVEEDFAQGRELGVTGTPAFLVNGEPIIGAQPLERFTSSIDDALAAAAD